jgi:hypothetical protein
VTSPVTPSLGMTAPQKTEWLRAANEAAALITAGNKVSPQLVAQLMIDAIPVVTASP